MVRASSTYELPSWAQPEASPGTRLSLACNESTFCLSRLVRLIGSTATLDSLD
ncbi:hypothetical protein [Kibdelosporangium philippinense]|uniref:hypothetical protein n=1 Tax=Kibdelosporangium philippinense TaxID=211113 RepID=UPI0035F09424